jgi:hypothetical protein
MATDKPGVMTFLNPELYKRLVAFKETQRLRSLSHAVELALGEYFDVAITPVTLHQAASPAIQPTRSPVTLTTKVDQLVAEQESLHQAVLSLHQMTEHLLVRLVSTLPEPEIPAALETNLSEPSARLTSTALNLLHTRQDDQGESITSLPPSTAESEHRVSAALARKGLTGLQLAERLKVHSSLISRKKQKSYFKAWTRQLDPHGLAWKYTAVTRRFHPVDRLPPAGGSGSK